MEVTRTTFNVINQRTRRRLDGADFQTAGFFVLRTPLLPLDELTAWGSRLQAPAAVDDSQTLVAALDADRRELRAWLRDLLSRRDVLEAIHVATPHLVEALETWRRNPDDKKGRRAEEALVRYAVRMTSRATPFGLFAGCTVGRIGQRTRLHIGPRSSYRRHSRLDMDYLFSLADELNRDRELRATLRYRPNSSLYRAAGRLRYAEARLDGQMLAYHLVAVEPDEFLDAAIARAADGATPAEIAEVVAASDPDGEISLEDAQAYVHELIDNQILVSELWPVLTGPEAVHGMIETLQRRRHHYADILRNAHEALESLDRQELGSDATRYREIARGLEPLPMRVDARRLYQVDLVKSGDAVLDASVLDEIARAVEVLHRLGPPDGDPLEGFKDRFLDRYGAGRLVPLTEAIDDEAGVGLPNAKVGADNSPLLEGLVFGSGEGKVKLSWSAREELLLAKLTEAITNGTSEIVLDDKDLARLENEKRPPMPDSFQAMAMVGATSEEALAAGEFKVYVRSAFGPSGARIVGRFCHADDELAGLVSHHLRVEESLQPDAVFAEVVHLPSGRIGNIASRPVLRDYEIPYLGVSGAPGERQIPIDDLQVTVEGGQVMLYSTRLGRRVLPRLTSAHNYVFGSLGMYRFLCSLQAQSVRTGLNWTWKPLENVPFLPRVRYGRAVLSRARWRVTSEEIAKLADLRDAERYKAAQQWRKQRGIPRRVMLADEDVEMLVDLENVLSLDAFVAIARSREDLAVSEIWPDFEELPTRGPEGRFVHELVIPFERRRPPTREQRPARAFPDVDRILPPTSQWLYLKLYTGAATSDLVLRDTVAPLVSRALESGAADRWFFIRYGDPQWHLRVRFGGEPQRLRGIIDMLAEHLDPELRAGRIWRWQLDTYEREIERYGGPGGIELAERIFHSDSQAVLAALIDLAGDQGTAARWRLATVGIDRLFTDFGFDLPAKRDLLAMMRAGFAAEFEAGADFNRQLARRLREVGDEVFELLQNGPRDPEDPLAAGFAALNRRSQQLAPLVTELRALESRRELSVPIADLLPSYVHMFVNRLIRSDHRAHELVLYDLLHRLTLSQLARAERKSPASDPMPARAG